MMEVARLAFCVASSSASGSGLVAALGSYTVSMTRLLAEGFHCGGSRILTILTAGVLRGNSCLNWPRLAR
jgi:hypothetical protein